MKRWPIVLVILLMTAAVLLMDDVLANDAVGSDLTTTTTQITTYTYTTSTSYTTTTTTYTLSLVTIETTSTTTSVTATYSSTIREGLTLMTTVTAFSTLYFFETASTTVTQIQTSTVFSPTLTIPTTQVIAANTTIYSPTIALTTTSQAGTTTTTTSTLLKVTTLYSPTVTVTSSTTAVTTIMPVGGPYRCIIASAAYGSELVEPVQFLREFRDQDVRSTFSGREFEKVFNSFYYSFSPVVATAIGTSRPMSIFTRLLLHPLVAILRVSSAIYRVTSSPSELRVVIAGMFASAFLGMVCITPLISVAQHVFRKKENVDTWTRYPPSDAKSGRNRRNQSRSGVSL
jgi:hypothetical protein